MNPLDDIPHTHFLKCRICYRLCYIRLCNRGANKEAKEFLTDGKAHSNLHGGREELIKVNGTNEWWGVTT